MDESAVSSVIKAAENVKEAEQPEETQRIYCGPNIPSKGIFCYQVFINGLPYNMKEMIAEIPEIEKLTVPVYELEDTRQRIREKGSLENMYYERIREKVNH